MRNYAVLVFNLLVLTAVAQEKPPIKFGKVSAEDFQQKVYSIDSGANAVVLADIGVSQFEGNSEGWFTFIHHRKKRIHILKKGGYDAANMEVYLYFDGKLEEDLNSLKAVTYNLENGQVVETRMDNKSVFTDILNKNRKVKKFTLPNVREGSIIEFAYSIRSPFLRSPTPWFFQGDYPVLWSDLEFQIPEFFKYVFITEGYHPFYKKQPPVNSNSNFRVMLQADELNNTFRKEAYNFTANIYTHRWVMKDVPALKLEKFTSSLMNHIAKIEFQLSEFRPPLQYRSIMQSWQMLTKELLESEYFGYHLEKGNAWMDDDLKKVASGAETDLVKAKRIYEFVRDNFTCTSHNAVTMSQILKNVLKTKKGNVAEINLILVSMLKNAGIQSDPVVLSTRSNGYVYALYPLLEKFNYVIAAAEIDGKRIYLDASYPGLGFGKLLPECYNGHARIVNKEATPLEFASDSLSERKVTSVFIGNDEKNVIYGSFQQSPGVNESFYIREKVMSKGMEEYFSNAIKDMGIEIKLTNKGVDSLKMPDEPFALHYDFTLNPGSDDVIYFNPMMNEGYKENPFKSAIRLYPVEMPYISDETYVFRMEIPVGYEIDELPKSIRVNFDESGSSYFEYLISASGDVISLRSRIKLTRSFYTQDEYEILREFFGMIVNKHSEQIVFKKKK